MTTLSCAAPSAAKVNMTTKTEPVPRRLSDISIEVDSHTHTIASGHAYSTLAENVRAAAERKLKLVAITDHGPAMPGGPHYWYFVNMKVIPRVIDGVGVLRGVEANIMNVDGDLDINDEIQAHVDIVLASLHEPIINPSNTSDHTKAVINAIGSGNIDVFAHGGNPRFPIDIDQVAQAAADHNVLVEINNSSFTTSRKGSKVNCEALAQAVARHGGLLTFGTDAHIASNIGIFTQCCALINELGIPEEVVLSRNASAYLDFLESKKRGTGLSELQAFINT